MEYYFGQASKLIKDVEEKLKEYCRGYDDSDCFPNRLQLKIKPAELLLSDVSEAMENFRRIINFKLIMFTFHIKDIVKNQIIMTFYFSLRKKAWIVEYPQNQ